MWALNEGIVFVFKLLENLDSTQQKILAVAQMYYWIILDPKLCTFGYSLIKAFALIFENVFTSICTQQPFSVQSGT